MRKTHKRVSHVKYGSYFLLIHFTNEICRGVRHICGGVEEEDALCEKIRKKCLGRNLFSAYIEPNHLVE